MRRQEFQHNTAEQVAGYLDEAWRIIAESALPDELHGAALAQVLALVASKQIVMEQVNPLGIVGPNMGRG